MDESKFFELQYKSLRDEIKNAKTRGMQILVLGISIVPAAQLLAKTQEAPEIFFGLPLVIITFALVYLAENHTIMRCGFFLRHYMETEVENIKGWETWLEDNDQAQQGIRKRTVDKFMAYAFYFIFFIYYIASVVLAMKTWGGGIRGSGFWVLIFYIIIGALSWMFVLMNMMTGSTARPDISLPALRKKVGLTWGNSSE